MKFLFGICACALAAFGAAAAPAPATVPFVGCKSDGQIGPRDAPNGAPKRVQMDARAAAQFAFYKAENGHGVLGPRSWNCFGLYGSNGSILFVAPGALDGNALLLRGEQIAGPAIQVTDSIGDTSGRFEVARIIARWFPAESDFVERVIAEGIEPAENFPRGPQPGDRLTYRSERVVEYETAQGLGTKSRLQNDMSIRGVAILTSSTPDLILLSLKLPPDMSGLAAQITQDIEHESAP